MDLMNMFKLWIDAIHPDKYQKVMKEQMGKGTFLWGAVKITAIATLLTLIISLIVNFVSVGIGSIGQPNMVNYLVGAIGLTLLIAVVGYVLGLVGFIINQYLILGLSRLLGGKGEINDQAYLLALVGAGISLATAVLTVVSVIPCLGALILFIGVIALAIWSLYLSFKILKAVHSLGTGAAIGVIVLDILFWTVVYGVIYAAFIFLLAPYIGPMIGDLGSYDSFMAY